MLPPTIIHAPKDALSFYITAISLCPTPSSVSVSWTRDTATFGATFKGPETNYVLGDSVFGAPVIAEDAPPKELSVSFNFGDTMTTQHSVDKPIIALCGPAGSAEKVIVKGYAAGDDKKQRPMIVTIMFRMEMKGVKRPE